MIVIHVAVLWLLCIITGFPVLFQSIIYNWPEPFQSIIPYWPEQFWSTIRIAHALRPDHNTFKICYCCSSGNCSHNISCVCYALLAFTIMCVCIHNILYCCLKICVRESKVKVRETCEVRWGEGGGSGLWCLNLYDII